jgi:hypothetical protein
MPPPFTARSAAVCSVAQCKPGVRGDDQRPYEERAPPATGALTGWRGVWAYAHRLGVAALSVAKVQSGSHA